MTANSARLQTADKDTDDMEAFEDHHADEDRLQDLDDADPTAPLKPAFPRDSSDQSRERANEERGNRGPDEKPGFGQGV
jgi:hypothetical protein